MLFVSLSQQPINVYVALNLNGLWLKIGPIVKTRRTAWRSGLEHHYGQQLFAKTTRGAEPTAAGTMLYQALCTAENDEKRLQAELDALANEKDALPPLRLGCTRTVAVRNPPREFAERRITRKRRGAR